MRDIDWYTLDSDDVGWCRMSLIASDEFWGFNDFHGQILEQYHTYGLMVKVYNHPYPAINFVGEDIIFLVFHDVSRAPMGPILHPLSHRFGTTPESRLWHALRPFKSDRDVAFVKLIVDPRHRSIWMNPEWNSLPAVVIMNCCSSFAPNWLIYWNGRCHLAPYFALFRSWTREHFAGNPVFNQQITKK